MHESLLNQFYKRAVAGLPVLGLPADMVREHSSERGHFDSEAMVRRYLAISAATGFVMGLPGWLAAPVTVPANIAGIATVQLHMVAAFASWAEEDLASERTRARCVLCLLDPDQDTPEDILEEEATDRTASKVAQRVLGFAVKSGIDSLRGRVMRKTVFRVPLVGAAFSAGADARLTHRVAECARHRFGVVQISGR